MILEQQFKNPIIEVTVTGKQISTNHAYPTNRTGIRYLSKDGKEYKELVYWTFKKHFKQPMITDSTNLNVTLDYYFNDNRRRDVNNYDKIILDAMTGIVYEDDSQVREVNFRKNVDLDLKEPYTIIKVYK